MKTFLALIALAAIGAAVYFYLNPRAAPVSEPVVATVEETKPPVAEEFPPDVPPLPPLAPTPPPLDDRPIMAILRERCRWPMEVTLTRPHPVKFAEGEMTLPAGRKLKMTMLTDDGRLLTTVAEIAVAVPFDATDFLDVLPAEASVKNSKSAPIAVSAPTRGARVVPERALADLKAKFPAAEKRKATVMIKNANQSKRRDVVEVDVPRPDVHARYRGWVMAATPASLPSIVNKLETQLAQDLAGLRGQYGSRENQSANAEAYHSYVWLNDTMRRYIAQLREIAAQR